MDTVLRGREKALVYRERAAKSYRVSAYFISKIIADQPIRILSLLIYVRSTASHRASATRICVCPSAASCGVIPSCSCDDPLERYINSDANEF